MKAHLMHVRRNKRKTTLIRVTKILLLSLSRVDSIVILSLTQETKEIAPNHDIVSSGDSFGK